jgi:sulfhydrogenase subunit delta
MMKSAPTVAFFDFAGCEGCQLTVLDALQTHPDLLSAIEIVEFREAISEKADSYDVAFVEGSCTRESDETRLRRIRDQATIVVALGACAHTGGVNAMRNDHEIDNLKRVVYADAFDHFEAHQTRPISEVIRIDAFLPGCPIDREEFIRAVKALCLGRMPVIPEVPVCMECKLSENACLLQQGKPCLGPITRAGCGALCPSLGVGCEGCRGMIPNPNLEALETIFSQKRCSPRELRSMLSLFLTHPLQSEEVTAYESS